MKKDDLVEVVAEYFTNDRLVARYSLDDRGGPAGDFFDAREKLGILGYMTKDEAVELLRSKKQVDKPSLPLGEQ